MKGVTTEMEQTPIGLGFMGTIIKKRESDGRITKTAFITPKITLELEDEAKRLSRHDVGHEMVLG